MSVRFAAINPVYEYRPFIEGSLFGFKTEYKKILVKSDGAESIVECAVCGLSAEDKIHDLIIRADRK